MTPDAFTTYEHQQRVVLEQLHRTTVTLTELENADLSKVTSSSLSCTRSSIHPDGVLAAQKAFNRHVDELISKIEQRREAIGKQFTQVETSAWTVTATIDNILRSRGEMPADKPVNLETHLINYINTSTS